MDGFAFIFRAQMEMSKEGQKKLITVCQGGFLSQFKSFSMIYVLHELLSKLGTYGACSV